MKAGVFFCLLCSVVLPNNAYQQWTVRRDNVKTDPSLVAYYTFEEFDGMQLKNLAGNSHTLTTQDIAFVPGRFPGKDAVRIDGGYFASNYPGNPKDSFDIKNNSFTFEIWMIKQTAGQDSHYGGMIFNCHSGYYNSWRVYTSFFPNGPILFSLGRTQGGPAVFSTAPVTDGVWHHIVATWDGKEVKLYIDGSLSLSKKYAEPYYPDLTNSTSFLGRPSWGVGRALLVVDELAIYNRALTEEEVKKHFLMGSGLPVAVHDKELFPESEVRISFPEIIGEYLSITGREKGTGGYFPVGTNIPVGFTLLDKKKQYTAHFAILDIANQTVLKDKSLVVSRQGDPVYKNIRVPDKCGIYWLQVTVEDNKRLLCRREFPFGVTVKLPDIRDISNNSPLGVQSSRKFPEAKSYGIKWDRGYYGAKTTWPNIEKIKGTYDWTETDKIVNDVTGSGNEMLFFIHGVPDWAAKGPKWGPRGPYYGPKDVEDMKRFVRALVNRYKDRVHYWEVWNEPGCNVMAENDSRLTWTPRAVEYTRILKATYEAIKEVDPTATVIGIGACPTAIIDFTTEVLKLGGGDYLDIIGIHNYMERNPNQDFAQHRKAEKVKEIIRTYTGRQIPIWDTETTFAAPLRVNRRPMSEEYYFKHSSIAPGADLYIYAAYPIVPEHRCAAWEIQATLLDFASGVDKRFLNTVRALNEHSIHERGVALAALAKVVSNKKDVRKFDTGTRQACGVLVTDRDGKRTAVLWSVNNRPAIVSLVLQDTARRYKGMDFLGNPIDFGKANQGLLTLSVSQEPLYVFDVPEKVIGARVMEIKGENVSSANVPYSGEIIIRNPLKKTLKAVVRPELPDGWRAKISCEVAVPAGAETSVPFILHAPEKTEGFFPLRFVLVSGKEPVATAESNVLIRVIRDIPQAVRNIVINGNTGKWDAIKSFSAVTETEEQVVIGRRDPLMPIEHPHWEGPDDLSFKVSTAWKTNELYVLVEVTDEQLSVAPEGKEYSAYLYDCVELFVDIRKNPDDITIKTTGAVQILVVPALTEKASGCRIAYLGNGITAKFVGRKTNRGYLVEGRISPLTGTGLTITEGQNIGLDIAVGDALGIPGKRKTQMVLFGSYSNWDNPSFWGRFRLIKGEEK